MFWLLLAIGFLIFVVACVRLLSRYPRIQDPGDELRMAVAMRAFETGKPVIGTVDDDGNLTMRVIERED